MQNNQHLFDVYCVPSPLIYFFYIKKEKNKPRFRVVKSLA